MFVDKATISIKSGKGGNGAVSFRREPYVPEGGPDGGDGGKGGDIVFVADNNLRTLMDFRYKKEYKAEDGQDGMNKKRYGKDGKDLIIKVPPGTLVIEKDSNQLMKDLIQGGDSFVAAKGGKGGKGNVHYKSSVRQAPNFAEAGGFAKERNVTLELKLIADVGLVGFPNVGKSTILSVATGAKPKIADYHFTTIHPNLGVVELFETGFVMADIAGIIEGAHQGAGLGFQFLKHVERTKVLIHVVDVSGCEGRNPIEDFDKINEELKQYNPSLLQKPQIVAANKIDLIDIKAPEYLSFRSHIEAKGYKVFPISAAINRSLKELLSEVAAALARLASEPEEETFIETFDFEKDEADPEYKKIHITKQSDGYLLTGKQLEKIFNSTNFNDTGSMRYLYKYLEKSDVFEQLKDMGLEEGDTVKVIDFEFEYFDEF